jgi:hypothetical protein
VKKYEVDDFKQPLVMVRAPTGAITGWFPPAFAVPQLLSAIVSPAAQQCLGAIQDRKIVLLSLQNATTRLNDEAMKGVNAFAADTHYGRSVKVVRADPADTAEATFMAQLKVDPNTLVATTVVMVPPGTIVGKFTGETDMDFMLTAVDAARPSKSRIPGMDGQMPGSP